MPLSTPQHSSPYQPSGVGDDSPHHFTPRRQIEQRTRLQEGRLHSAVQLRAVLWAVPAAIVVVDGAGLVRDCNPAAEILLGADLWGRRWRELILELFESDAPTADPLQLRSGRLVTVATQSLGSVPGQVLLLQDVTEQHRLSTQLGQIRRLSDMGRMAASLAHQIRTPLATAMLYISRLSTVGADSEFDPRFINRALESLRGLERLVNDMLLFARDGEGEREPIMPAELFVSLLQEMDSCCRDRGIVCSVKPQIGSDRIMVNRALLKSTLQNLLQNAIEADATKVTLQQRGGDGYVELVIRDDGCGIEPQLQQRIFEPFVSGRSGGTGLGLAVVMAVTQAMGGTVGLRSRPGEGAQFTLRFHAVSPNLVANHEGRE